MISQTQRIFDIANYSLVNVSEEEKNRFPYNPIVNGNYQGYKRRQSWVRGAQPFAETLRYKVN